MGRTNGTFVNGNRISDDTPVGEGDIVQFAEFEFIVGRLRVADATRTHVSTASNWIQTLIQFQQLLANKAVVPHFQPMNIQPLAEGVECSLEAAVCADLGFTLAQGYFFGKPASAETFLRTLR